ncbi:MAG: retropepsin-like aspartic protease [Candidatus Omnitrophica bacterium]|nr:retropepsin-like aspartic protease [Candidatus Omnitrophota bacterium]
MKKYLLLIGLGVMGFVGLAHADMVYLKNGRAMEGVIKSEDSQGIELEISIGTVKFQKSEISRIEKSEGQDAALRSQWEKDKQVAEERRQKIIEEEEKKPKTVEFAKDKQSIIVDCLLDNKVSARLVLDTGATTVVLRNSVAQRLLGMNSGRFIPDMKVRLADGRIASAKFIIIGSLKVQDAEAKRVEACVLTSDVGGADMQDGLLGMSFLKNFKFTIDQENKKLILEKQ